MSDAFYCVGWDEDCDWDESYDMLRGPDGFECLLTEPEDRIWLRDGRPVVAKLNEQADAIELLTARLAAAEAAARWLWPKVSDDAYDAAWEKWPWLDSESAKGGRDAE